MPDFWGVERPKNQAVTVFYGEDLSTGQKIKPAKALNFG